MLAHHVCAFVCSAVIATDERQPQEEREHRLANKHSGRLDDVSECVLEQVGISLGRNNALALCDKLPRKPTYITHIQTDLTEAQPLPTPTEDSLRELSSALARSDTVS